MNRRVQRVVVASVWTFMVCLLCVIARASEMQETGDFGVVRAKAIELGKQHSPQNVLLVFDIDNTLLAGNQPLGSDQWYDWQADLLKNEPTSPMRVADNLDGLLRVQGILFTLGHMHPPQKDQPQIVKELQRQGFPTLVLTSRGPANRNATIRQLNECGYDFASCGPRVAGPLRGVRLPYSLDDMAASGVSQDEARSFGLGTPREVSYDQGVFMTSGQNKGAMLLVLLAHCPRRFSAVIFVDDKERNTKLVYSALDQRHIEVFAYRYSAEDAEVQTFSDAKKQQADREWKELHGIFERVFEPKPVAVTAP